MQQRERRAAAARRAEGWRRLKQRGHFVLTPEGASGLLGKPRLHPGAVASVVWNGFVLGTQTAVAGVESLRPGQLRWYGADGRLQEDRDYWSMPPADNPGSRIGENELGEVLLHLRKLSLDGVRVDLDLHPVEKSLPLENGDKLSQILVGHGK